MTVDGGGTYARTGSTAGLPRTRAELELSPVVARPEGAVAITGQVRIQAAETADSYLRRLR